MNETIKGTIKVILDVQSGTAKATGNEWKKQNFVVSNNDGYEGREQIFCFEVFGAEKVENLTKYNNVGSEVEVSFNIKTNEYQGKYYTSLQAWKIQSMSSGNSTPESTNPAETFVAEVTDDSDLPF